MVSNRASLNVGVAPPKQASQQQGQALLQRMSTPGPRLRMRGKRPVPQPEEEDEDAVIIEDDDDEPGPSNRPAKSRRTRAPASHAASRPAMQQPTSYPTMQPQSQPMPNTPGTAQRTGSGARERGRREKAELAQMTEKVKKYREAADKHASEANFTLTQMELDTLSGRVVRYMLFAETDKPGGVVSRTKLNDVVTADNKNHKHVKKLLARVLPEAQARLLEHFGIEMCELERRGRGRDENTAASSSGTAYYVLQSALPSGLRESAVWHYVGGPGGPGGKPALAMTVLGLLRMEGGEMEEGVLWRWLSQLCLFKDGPDADHPVFMKVSSELARLVSIRWLLCHKGNAKAEGGVELIYEAGEAARAEISDRDLQEYMEQVFYHYEFGNRSRTPATAVRDDDMITIDEDIDEGVITIDDSE